MTLDSLDWDFAYWLSNGFDSDQSTALAAFAAAVIEDDIAYRNAIILIGTQKYLKWNADPAAYPEVVDVPA